MGSPGESEMQIRLSNATATSRTPQQNVPLSYGGTQFCLVAVPSPSQSPKMPRKNKRLNAADHNDNDDEELPPPIQNRDTHDNEARIKVIDDRRLSNPAFDDSVDGVGEHEVSNGCQLTSSRLDKLLLTLRNDLKSLQHQDQALLRQFLNIYQTISDLHCDAPLASFTTPSPPVIQFQGSAALSPAIMADEVRDLVSYQGQLNIKDVVSRLSPIRRRRTSEPFGMDGDLSFDQSMETEDPLSLSSPFL